MHSVGVKTFEPLHQHDVVLRRLLRKTHAGQGLAFALADCVGSSYPSGYLEHMGFDGMSWAHMLVANMLAVHGLLGPGLSFDAGRLSQSREPGHGAWMKSLATGM